MTILFYILVSLFLVLIKTSLISGLPMLGKFYDLLIPIIIYLSLLRSAREGIPVVLFCGLIMDSLCGGPPGLFLAIYGWLYAGVRWAGHVMHAGSIVLMVLAVAIGVVFENAVLMAYMLLLAPAAIVPVDAAMTVLSQVIWALVTGPLILMIVTWSQNRLDAWREGFFSERLDPNSS